jgi:hypothetical protein
MQMTIVATQRSAEMPAIKLKQADLMDVTFSVPGKSASYETTKLTTLIVFEFPCVVILANVAIRQQLL